MVQSFIVQGLFQPKTVDKFRKGRGSLRRIGDATTGVYSLLAFLGDTGHILISAERDTLLLLTVRGGGVVYLLPHCEEEEGH